jgi:hypothetical protein
MIFTDPEYLVLMAIGRKPKLPYNFAVGLHSFTASHFQSKAIVCNPLHAMVSSFQRAKLPNNILIPLKPFDNTEYNKIYNQSILQQNGIPGFDVRKDGCISFDYNPHLIVCTDEFRNFYKTVFGETSRIINR